MRGALMSSIKKALNLKLSAEPLAAKITSVRRRPLVNQNS